MAVDPKLGGFYYVDPAPRGARLEIAKQRAGVAFEIGYRQRDVTLAEGWRAMEALGMPPENELRQIRIGHPTPPQDLVGLRVVGIRYLGELYPQVSPIELINYRGPYRRRRLKAWHRAHPPEYRSAGWAWIDAKRGVLYCHPENASGIPFLLAQAGLGGQAGSAPTQPPPGIKFTKPEVIYRAPITVCWAGDPEHPFQVDMIITHSSSIGPNRVEGGEDERS
jgi:hypothetical protein